jgi:opacity protein-like surface antigen
MIKETLFGLVGGALCLSTALATETVQPTSVNALIGLSAQDADADAAAPAAAESTTDEMYLRIGAGLTFITDTKVKNSVTFPNDSKAQWNTGFGFDVAWGIPVADDFALEIGVGIQYNGLKALENSGVTVNVDGTLWQVPLMFSGVYDFHLTDTLTLGARAGAGLQYNSFQLDQQNVVFVGATNKSTQTSWTFRYQVGLDLTWALSNTSSLGAYATFAWAPGIESDLERTLDRVFLETSLGKEASPAL